MDPLISALTDSGATETFILWAKIMAVGASSVLVALLSIFTASLYRHREPEARLALHFTLANAFAAIYIAADTFVRLHVLQGAADSILTPYRVAVTALVLAVAAYVALFESIRGRAVAPVRIVAVYVAALGIAGAVWVTHPWFIIASGRTTLRGSSAFADYGLLAAPLYLLCLGLFVAVSVGILRLATRISDALIRWLVWFGFLIIGLGGLHDVLREGGVLLLPFNALPLACAAFQVAAFAVMVMHYSRTLAERAQQQHQLRRLKDTVDRDALSGLFSRAYLEDRLDNSGNAGRGGLLFIDIDHFKAVNDRYGHAVGDELIQELSHVLLTTLRQGDVPSRWGGDEFVVFLADADQPGAERMIERLRWRLGQIRLQSGLDALPTTSMGFALIGSAGWRAALEQADAALYRAKMAGRNQLDVA